MSDKNNIEVCTKHSPFSFSGIDGVTPLSKWCIPSSVAYSIFLWVSYPVRYSTSTSTFDNSWQKLAKTGDDFFKTDILPVGAYVCYNVRYESLNLPDDNNTKTACTSATASASTFSGIETATSPGPGKKIDLTWSPVTNDTVAY